MPKRILIIDDDEACRFLYRLHLGRISDIEIIAEFENAEEALQKIPLLKPDVIIVDHTLPGMSGINLVQRLNQSPPIKVLLVTGHDPEHFDSDIKASPTFEFVQKDWSERNLEHIIAFCM